MNKELGLPGLRAAREAAGFSQGALAGALGVTRQTVVRWENGRASPRGRERPAEVADLLGCSVADLYGSEHVAAVTLARPGVLTGSRTEPERHIIGDLSGLKLPRPFYVSNTGGSGFRLHNVLECPRKAALYLAGWRVKRLPVYFPFGTVVHSRAFEPYLRDDAPAGEALAEAAAADVEQIVQTERVEREERLPTGEWITSTREVSVTSEEQRKLPTIARNGVSVWHERRYPVEQVVACESRLSCELVDPDSGDVAQEFQGFHASGRLDLVLRLDRGVKIADLKTTASPISDEWARWLGYWFQLGLYRYVWTALHVDQPVNALALYPLTKNMGRDTVAKHAREIPADNPPTFRAVYEALARAVRLLLWFEQAGDWPKWGCPGQCEGKFGRPCEFFPLCWSDHLPADTWKQTLDRRDYQ